MSGRSVGIDLGTSNSVVSVIIDGEAIVIPDADGRTLQPSVASFLPDGRTIVGHKAKSRMVIDPANTVYSVKRLVGRPYYAPEIALAARKYAYPIVQGADDVPLLSLRNRLYSPEDIQGIILRHIRTIAEEYLGEPVTRAVITVPANFNEGQRRATRTAGELAGLEVLRILNEPTAAALAYGYEQSRRERIAVYDFGGGTFDITVLELRDNVFEVLSTAGDTFLGGDDFDHRIAGILAGAFKNTYDVDLTNDRTAMQRLKAIAERMKIELTDSESATGTLKQTIPGSPQPVEFSFSLTREQFNTACVSIVQQTFLVSDEALKLAGLTSSEVDRLVLVGGSTRVPLVRDMVSSYFFCEPLTDINPDEVVAVGAAIYAYGLEEQNRQPVAPPPPPPSARPPIPGSRPPLPSYAPDAGATSAGLGDASAPLHDVEFSVVPEPARAPRPAPLLLDVTSHSLGIETVGGLMDTVIHRNTTIPARVSRAFITSRDHQTEVAINIYEGDSGRVEDNRLLGCLTLLDLEDGLRGDTKIDISFDINTDGLLNVTARDRNTGRIQQTRLQIAGGAASGATRAQTNLPSSGL